VTLSEESEANEVEPRDGKAVKRTLTTTTNVLYTSAQQPADWGAPSAPANPSPSASTSFQPCSAGAPGDPSRSASESAPMSDITTHLLLPYILASQAQKHVTHNEALRLLDTMVQLSVLDRTRTVPPFSPVDGDRHIVASGATGPWSGWDQNVAFWVDGVKMRLVPHPGWLGWIADEAVFVVWNGSAWDPVGAPVDVSDAIFSLVNDADPTKKALFSLSGSITGTTRTFTLPNTSSELAILAGTQTFSGTKIFSGTLTARAPSRFRRRRPASARRRRPPPTGSALQPRPQASPRA
jgi:hypothetical protein